MGFLLSACLKESSNVKAQDASSLSSTEKAKALEEAELDLKVNIKVSVTIPEPVSSSADPAPLPFDLRQDFFNAYKQELWPETEKQSLYGDMPYQVIFDGDLKNDGIETTGKALRLSPTVPEDAYSTHASLLSTSLGTKVPANFFWFEVDMTTEKQLRDKPNLWERGWITWNLEKNTDPKQAKILKEIVPYTFYYFYVKESDTTFPGIEIGKLEPANPDTWDCSYNVSPEVAQANIDCDNDGKVDDLIYGAQRFFPLRFDPNEPMAETGDCLVTSTLPRFGFGLGKTHTFRILQHQDGFEIYWLRQNLNGETITQKLVSCKDLLDPYTQGGIGFYTEDATVLFDNFRLQSFEFANLAEPSSLGAGSSSETANGKDENPDPEDDTGSFGVQYKPDLLKPNDLPTSP